MVKKYLRKIFKFFTYPIYYHQVTILLHFEYSEYFVDFELFFREMLSLESSHLDRESLKSRLNDLVFSSFKTYNSFRKRNNLTFTFTLRTKSHYYP